MYNTDLPSRAELPSSRQLIRSTALALVAAGALLIAAVLPAEYGMDPTGIGTVLGLTQMGQTKAKLSTEAAAAAAVAAAPTVSTPVSPPVARAVAPPSAAPSAAPAPAPVAQARAGKRDELSLTLRPGQGAEVKLDMRQGDKVDFSWQVRGGVVNFDTHGDPVKAPKDFYHGYGKGRDSPGDKGTLQAAFDGQHGWFWRNRGKADVEVTLTTQGQYAAMKRVL